MTTDPDTPRKARYHHGDLRAELIEATRRLVEDTGPDGFSVSQACRVAGVSTAAPYRHFKDRGEMLLAVMADGVDCHYRQMVDALEGIAPGKPDRIVALGLVYVGFAQAEPGIFRLIFGRKAADPDPALLSDKARCYELLETEVASVLGSAEVDERVRQRAFMLWTFVHGLSFLLIEDKVSVSEMALDTKALLQDVTARMLA